MNTWNREFGNSEILGSLRKALIDAACLLLIIIDQLATWGSRYALVRPFTMAAKTGLEVTVLTEHL